MEYSQYFFGGSNDTRSPPFMKSGNIGTNEVHVIADYGPGKKGGCVLVNTPPSSQSTCWGSGEVGLPKIYLHQGLKS